MLYMKAEEIKLIIRTAMSKDKSFCVLYVHIPSLQRCHQLGTAALKRSGALSLKLLWIRWFSVDVEKL